MVAPKFEFAVFVGWAMPGGVVGARWGPSRAVLPDVASVAEWGEDFTDILAGSPCWMYTVRIDGAAWRVRTGPDLFAVYTGGDEPADVTVSGPPTAMLRWLRNR
jgi:hypothetical protein